MEMLRRDLDDPFAEPCGRCDVCAGPWYPTDVSERRSATARDAIDRPGVDLEARTQWPTGMAALGVDVKGKIAADEQMADGRAVARLSDIGWGTRLRELVGPGAADDAPVTPAVVNAVVAVLKTWGWARAPGRRRGDAVTDAAAADRLARRAHRRARQARAARLAGLRPRRTRPAATAATAPTASPRCGSASSCRPTWRRRWRRLRGPVLLVDDVADSRWTLTVAARALRRAGATAVLPLAPAIDA